MAFCRWLALHNSTLSVRDIIEQINRPAEKAVYEAAVRTNSSMLYGSTENFVQYLKFGMFCAHDPGQHHYVSAQYSTEN